MTSVQIASVLSEIKKLKKKLRQAAKIQADVDAGTLKKPDASQREKLNAAGDLQKKLDFHRKKLKQLGGQEPLEEGDDDGNEAEAKAEFELSEQSTPRQQPVNEAAPAIPPTSIPLPAASAASSLAAVKVPHVQSGPAASASAVGAAPGLGAQDQSLPELVARALGLGGSYKLRAVNVATRPLKNNAAKQAMEISIRFVGRVGDIGAGASVRDGTKTEADDEDDGDEEVKNDAEERGLSRDGHRARRRLDLDVSGGAGGDRSRTPSPPSSLRARSSSGVGTNGHDSVSNTPRHSCRKGFQCAYRLKCKYRHTDEEMALWKNFSYLTMPCSKIAALPAGSTSCGEAQCTFYHSQTQARCLCCLTHLLTGHLQLLSECVGHSESNCPNKASFAARQQPSYMSPRRQQHQHHNQPHSPYHGPSPHHYNNNFSHNNFSPRSDRYRDNRDTRDTRDTGRRRTDSDGHDRGTDHGRDNSDEPGKMTGPRTWTRKSIDEP